MAHLPARVMLIASVLASSSVVAAQGAAPQLTREQRATLLGLVNAVKQTALEPAIDDGAWPIHLFRASDGSHYVAFAAPAPPDVVPQTPLAVYIRLAHRGVDASSSIAERSAVEEWLLGHRSNPLPMRAGGVVQIPSGELPVGGPLSMSGRDTSGQSSAALALLERQRQRERAAIEARERARRDEMEGHGKDETDLLPFEDFDMEAHAVVRAGPTTRIERSLTAGPGEYDLLVAWATLDGRQKPTQIGVLRRALILPAVQSTELMLGTIVLADDIRVRSEIYRATEQSAHPYAIGATEIAPAADHVYTSDERLSVAFQIINPSGDAAGKPDVTVGFRLFRIGGTGEQPAGTLSPLQYNASNLPVDFDLALGHPILAAMAAPLGTLPRGEYRLAITATDRLSRTSVSADVRFRIAATPDVLLAAAPPFAPAFRREGLVEPHLLGAALDTLQPSAVTPAIVRLLSLARDRKFAELLPDVTLTPAEAGTGVLLQSIGFYALGDSATAVRLQLLRALDAGAPRAVAQLYIGACAAIDGRDVDAVGAWLDAVASGLPAVLVARPLAETYARLGQLDEARGAAARALDQGTIDPELTRLVAAADVHAGRDADALTRLDALLAVDAGDDESRWLAMHALFAGFVRNAGPGATPPGRARFVSLANTYIDADGRWRALADEWRALVTASLAVP